MSSAQISNATAGMRPQAELSARLILLLATGTGLTVASLYYAQPMLGIMTDDIHASNTAVGWVPTLTQLGYALGILLLVPLGDIIDRRRIVLIKGAILTLALLAAAVAPGIGTLLAASLAIGLTATMAQDIVPAAAAIAVLRCERAHVHRRFRPRGGAASVLLSVLKVIPPWLG